jgi:hypothetical protein
MIVTLLLIVMYCSSMYCIVSSASAMGNDIIDVDCNREILEILRLLIGLRGF